MPKFELADATAPEAWALGMAFDHMGGAFVFALAILMAAASNSKRGKTDAG